MTMIPARPGCDGPAMGTAAYVSYITQDNNSIISSSPRGSNQLAHPQSIDGRRRTTKMDDQQFDTMVRAFASGISRRGALGILAGLAGFQVGETDAAKRRRKHDRPKGASKKKNRKKSPRAQSGAKKKDKFTICHRTGSETNPFVIIEVGDSAVPAHEAHGDIISPDFENDPANCGGCAVSCDDANPCTTDTCVEGVCVNTPVDCDDDNECTDDSCDETTGACVNTPVAGRGCNDGDPCTENDVCDARGNCAGTQINCDDGDICTADSCQGGTCVNDPIPDCCENDDECPRGQICVDNRCTDDPNPECTGETCDTFTQCSAANSDCVCTTTSTGGGFCTPGSTLCAGLADCDAAGGCPAGSLCAVDTCCVTPVCIPNALECTEAALVTPSRAGNGPTIAGR